MAKKKAKKKKRRKASTTKAPRAAKKSAKKKSAKKKKTKTTKKRRKASTTKAPRAAKKGKKKPTRKSSLGVLGGKRRGRSEQLTLDVAPSPRTVDPIALAEALEVRDVIAPKLRKRLTLTIRQKAVWHRVNARENVRQRDEGTKAAEESFVIALTGLSADDLKGYVAAGMPAPTKRHGKEPLHDAFSTIPWIVAHLKSGDGRLAQDRFAEAAGVSIQSLSNWEKDQGMPPPHRAGRGRDKVVLYGWQHVRWIIAHYDELRKAKAADPEDAVWDRRLKKAKALKAERDLDESEGRLVERDVVEEQLADAVRTVRARLEVLGDRVAPLCAGLEERAISSVVDREISIVLEEFARGAGTAVHHGDTEDTEETTS